DRPRRNDRLERIMLETMLVGVCRVEHLASRLAGIGDDLRELRPRAVRRREVARADMHETCHLLAGLDAENVERGIIIGDPLGAPVGDIAMRLRRKYEVEGQRASRKNLF